MSDQSHAISIKAYIGIFALLLLFTALTVWVAGVDLGILNTAVALGIAITKAVLVILYFMHVRYSSRLTWVFAGAGFYWFVIFIALIFSDYATR